MSEQALTVEEDGGWELKKLTPKHKQVCSMLAQGIPRTTISTVCNITPEYVTMLAKQPLVKAYIGEMCQAAGLQLDAMFVQSVEAIGDALANGSHADKMKAARLQMEATKRIGSGGGVPKEIIDTNDRLARLAERLLYLQSSNLKIIESRRNENGVFQPIEAGQSASSGFLEHDGADSTAQVNGDGKALSSEPERSEDGEGE